MTKDEQEINEVVQHLRFFCALLICTELDIISAESSWFVNMFERGVRGIAGSSKGRGPDTRGSLSALVRVPFVDVMTI